MSDVSVIKEAIATRLEQYGFTDRKDHETTSALAAKEHVLQEMFRELLAEIEAAKVDVKAHTRMFGEIKISLNDAYIEVDPFYSDNSSGSRAVAYPGSTHSLRIKAMKV